MSDPLDGVRVIEVAGWTFVPGAGAIMADLGADVIKVEPPDRRSAARDAQRAQRKRPHLPNPFLEVPNRGKRSITLDLGSDGGAVGAEPVLAAAPMCFSPATCPSHAQRLRIDFDDFSAALPRLIYVRGSGWGSKGPMVMLADSIWRPPGRLPELSTGSPLPAPRPVLQPAAFYDLQGSNAIAGAVGMALFQTGADRAKCS